MKLKTFARLGGRGRRLVWGGALMGLLMAAGTTAVGDLSEEGKRLADERRESLSLFAGPTAVLQGNQLQCGIRNNGDVCANVFNSPTGGGGFWPTGSQNQYIFNTGLQVAGIMGPDGGPWANDTVGAFFFDASGTVPSGTPLTQVFNSLNPDDAAAFEDPARRVPEDPTLFQPVLQGRPTASQQDSWVQYWDGDPARISGRQHPMGLTVTQRSLAWNYPAGNESLIYFLYNFENVTQSADFQTLNEAQFFGGSNDLPDSGITFNEMYAAFATDMDVTGNAGQNFSTAVLPFDLGLSYHGGFSAPEFTYPAELFSPPFFTNAPGLIGVKYLRSPINPETDEEVGLTLFSATLNSATGFPDPRSDKQLWRYLSGKVNPAQGDFPCNITPEVTSSDPSQVQRSLCFLAQTAQDTRFYQASGPFSMAPGEQATIVVAYIAAATVATLPDGSASGILANNADDSANPPGVPSFHPGFASARGCADANNVGPATCTEFAAATDPEAEVKAIERGAGWVEYTGSPPGSALENGDNKLDQNDVTVVPGSLLGKALVAQTIFNSRFLLGFAPEQPTFYLVPGNNQVTVVWDRSPTEDTTDVEGGDPFFAVANNPESALFNPNYRQFDVEGYRVWRGTSSGQLTLLAQFDYGNTSFTDQTCETVTPTEEVGALRVDATTGDTVPAGPGFAAGEICPDDFSVTRGINRDLVFNNGGSGGSPGDGVARLIDGTTAYSGDPITAIESDDAGAKLPLTDGGVPFVYVDETVTNNFTYFYAVSAFDVNSAASGPHTLRSARVTKSTIPRADAPNLVNAELQVTLASDEGEPLTIGLPPSIDSEDGTFSGPFPPTNGVALDFAPAVQRLLPTFSRTVTIDSLVPDDPGTGSCPAGTSALGTCWHMYLSVDAGGSVTESVIDGFTPVWSAFGDPDFTTAQLVSAEVPFDQDALDAFGIPSGSGTATAVGTFDESIVYSTFEGQWNRRNGGGFISGGSRWFSGENESVPDPTKQIEVGQLDGVTQVWAPIHHTPIAPGTSTTMAGSGQAQCFGYGFAFLGRAADVEFTWGGGTFSEVRDVTHQAGVPFKPNVQASWGFLNADANGNGVIDWDDFLYLENVSATAEALGFCGHTDNPAERVTLEDAPVMQDVLTDPTVNPQTSSAVSGQGFGLYANGQTYIFVLDQMPADGTTWTLRTYTGVVDSEDEGTDNPTNYSYDPAPDGNSGLRPPTIPNLQFVYQVEEATNLGGTVDLTQVHTVPDPYRGSSLYDRAPTSKNLMFVNLPEQATIRIYTLTGVLVDVLVHDDITGGGRIEWDIRNRNNQFVASGVYFFHVMTPDGDEHVGKFTIINQAGSN